MSLFKKIMKLSSFLLASLYLSSCSMVNDYYSYSKRNMEDNRFTITWNDGNGKEIYTEYVKKGEIPVFKSDVTPTKNANTQYTYTFNNTWEPEIEVASRDITYTAQFDTTLNKYRVNFISDGHLLEFQEYNYGDTPSYSGIMPEIKEDENPDPDSLFENRFVGWEPEISKVTGNADYYAVYKSIPKNEVFNLTFEFNNGNEPLVKEYSAGQVIEYPSSPSKIGYTFSSWDYIITQMPDFDLTIKALYSLSAPGEYLWSSSNDYETDSGKSYSTFTSFDDLISNNKISINNSNEVTSYSSSNPTVLILPSYIKGIRTINNSNLRELFVNTTVLNYFTFYPSCMIGCGIRKLFIEGDGKVIFPGHASDVDKGYFSKSNACFDNQLFREVYFHNKQEILNIACLSNQKNSLSKLVLPDTLQRLYYYSFFNTGITASSPQYIFVNNMSIETIELPSSLVSFYYINTSNPLVSYTTFVYKGNQESWDNVTKYSYVYSSASSITGSASLPSKVDVTFK